MNDGGIIFLSFVAMMLFMTMFAGHFSGPEQQLKRAARRVAEEERIAAAHAERERLRTERKAKRTAALQASLLFAVWTWFTIHPITRALLIILTVAAIWYLVDGRYAYRQDGSTFYRIDRITGDVCRSYSSGWFCR